MNPKPPLPSNEIARLHALRQYGILDTPPEKVFDDFTFLAAQVCRTPVALISLVDGNRQWFKSKIGVTVSETNRDVAFCAYSILQQKPLVVRNALLDTRFARNPLVTSDPHIRFYAGAPLITSEGFGIGTLCVIDSVPRDLTPEQVESLRLLSNQVVAQLELRRNAMALSRTVIQRQQAAAQLRRQQEFVEVFYTRGEEKANKGDYEGAIAEFNQFLRLNPKGFKAYYSRGVARHKLGDSKGAVADLDLYLQFYPNNSEARYYRGLLRLELGDYQGAIADYSHIMHEPDNMSVGNLHLNSEFEPNQQALFKYDRSSEIYPHNNVETDINLLPDNTIPQLNDYNDLVDEDYPQPLLLNYNKSEVYISPSYSEYEIEENTKPFGLNPALSQTHISRGNGSFKLEDSNSSIEDYTKHLALNPDDTDVYLKRADARFKLKDYNGALEDYTQFIRRNPNDSKAYLNRGNCRYELEDYDGAIEDYNRSLELNPHEPEVYMNRANARSKIKDYSNAIEDYTQFLQLKPDDAKAYISRGNARSKLKDYSGAIEDYKKVWSKPILQSSSLLNGNS